MGDAICMFADKSAVHKVKCKGEMEKVVEIIRRRSSSSL